MTTFYGKQTGEADPVLAHAAEPLDAFTGAQTFKGAQTGEANPTIIGSIKKTPEQLAVIDAVHGRRS